MPIHDCGGSCSSSSDPFSCVRDQIQSQAICPVFRDQLTIACFSTANLVARFGKDMVTPPVSDGALPGTVRRRLLERLPIAEMSLTPADLERADEIISTNSLGVRRLSALGGVIRPLGRELFGAASEI